MGIRVPAGRPAPAPWAAVALGIALGTGCTSAPEAPVDGPCHPFAETGCLGPWPSDYFLRETPEGRRLRYSDEALPAASDGARPSLLRFARADGFSIGAQPFHIFPGGIARDGLPPLSAPEQSLAPESLVHLIDLKDEVRVPCFAEPDVNAPASGPQTLIVRPLAPLAFDRDYGVVIWEGIKDRSGAPLSPPAAFSDRWRQATEAGPGGWAAGLARLRQILTRLGHAPDDAYLAWTFRTATEANRTARLDRMIARVSDFTPTFRWVEQETFTDEDARLWRRGIARFTVPSFLKLDDPDAFLDLDENGDARPLGTAEATFRINVPRCAQGRNGPLPVVVNGHGIFSSTEEELESPYHEALAQNLCAVVIGTDWTGVTIRDLAGVLQTVLGDVGEIYWITDRLLQAHVHQHVLLKLVAERLPGDSWLGDERGPILATDGPIDYYGLSNGGIQGTLLVSLSPRIRRALMHVSGGWWSMMLDRSTAFAGFDFLLSTPYPDPTDRMALLLLSQTLWDAADPINYAHRLRDRAAPAFLLQEAQDDDRLPNIVTRAMVRHLDLPQLGPTLAPVWGVRTDATPATRGYTQWDVQPERRMPATNQRLPALDNNQSPHELLRIQPACQAQIRHFFATGQIENFCDGPCISDARFDD